MNISVPKEIKNGETRVGLTPAGCARLVAAGVRVRFETGAGARAGFDDGSYRTAGAEVVASAAAAWIGADLVVKVKEPQPSEFGYLRPDLALFTYLHLAAAPELEAAIRTSGLIAIAYENVAGSDGSLPLLKPMSQIAGRLATQVGARFLESAEGGGGVLLGGVPGVRAGRVTVVGAGNSGAHACRVAIGLGAQVTVLDLDVRKLEALDTEFGNRIATLAATPVNVAEAVAGADLVIGAVLVPGARAPVVISRAMVGTLRPGSVIVDIAIDQGGCVEGIRPTSLARPIYREGGVAFYAAPNMPALVGRTATLALTQATEPFLLRFAKAGVQAALETDPALAGAVAK
jgi:alanine dehydrogenase